MLSWLNSLHERAKAAVNLWGSLGAIVGIFCLGCGATAWVIDRMDEGANQAVLPIDRRLVEQNSRIDNVITWAREQIAYIQGQVSRLTTEQAEQYRALNTRLDAQNALLVELIKLQKQGPEAKINWSIINSARASN